MQIMKEFKVKQQQQSKLLQGVNCPLRAASASYALDFRRVTCFLQNSGLMHLQWEQGILQRGKISSWGCGGKHFFIPFMFIA